MSEFVSESRIWKCPHCGELLRKGALGSVWQPGQPIDNVAGTGTCSKCGAEFRQADIYGGRYDPKDTAVSEGDVKMPRRVSVVVFDLMSRTPLGDAMGFCRNVLDRKYPASDLDRYYVVGFLDDLTPDEALAAYKDHVRAGRLPDLGRQFDTFKGGGPQGRRVVALFFQPD